LHPGPARALRLFVTVYGSGGYYTEDDFPIRVVP
jgi:hypothetical protein